MKLKCRKDDGDDRCRSCGKKYREVFGDDTNTRNKQWLIKRIAWRIQANAMGGLSESEPKRRAAELANDADVRILDAKEPSDDQVRTKG